MQTIAAKLDSGAACSGRMEAANHQQLGKIVLRCRPRSRIGAWLESGTPPLPILLAPFVVALIATLIPVVVSQRYFNVPPPAKDPMVGGAAVTWFVVWVGVVFCYLFSAPETPFELHEKGFTYRRRIIRFSDLSSIRFGLPRSPLQNAMLAFSRMLAPVSRHARSAIRIDEAGRDSSLTLEFRDGRTLLMRGFLCAYHMADLKQLLGYIQAEYPDLFR